MKSVQAAKARSGSYAHLVTGAFSRDHASSRGLTHGRRLFSRGRKNASKKIIPPKMALGEGLLYALRGEVEKGGRGSGKQIF